MKWKLKSAGYCYQVDTDIITRLFKDIEELGFDVYAHIGVIADGTLKLFEKIPVEDTKNEEN